MIRENKNHKITILRIVRTAIIMLIVIFIFLWVIPFSCEIDSTIKALMISGVNTDETEIKIKIKGKYIKHFFREDRFVGNFMIDGFAITQKQNNTIDIKVGKQTDVNLIYHTYNGSQLAGHSFGLIYVNKGFKNLLIIPYKEYLDNPAYEGDNGGGVEISGETITIICYPAKTRNEAVKAANSKLKFFNKYIDEDFHMN